jgi:hypothetical protein
VRGEADGPFCPIMERRSGRRRPGGYVVRSPPRCEAAFGLVVDHYITPCSLLIASPGPLRRGSDDCTRSPTRLALRNDLCHVVGNAAEMSIRIVAPLMMFVASCSLGPYVSDGSIDYNRTVEKVTENVIVTNILRGRDAEPLFFSDLSQIRGSFQISAAGQASWPFGPFVHNVSRTNSVQLGPMSVQSSPTFDIAPLNTKQFAQGISEPINTNELWFFLQRDFDLDVILPLLVSKVTILTRTGNPKDPSKPLVREEKAHLPDVLREWIASAATGRWPKVVVYSRLSQVGPPLPLTVLRTGNVITELSQASTSNLDVKVQDGTVRLYKTSKHNALCIPRPDDPEHYEAVGIVSGSLASGPSPIDVPETDDACVAATTDPVPPAIDRPLQRKLVYLRSVEAIFYYLGAISAENPNPLKFYLHAEPIPDPAFSVEYHGRTYYIAKYSEGVDNTVAILAILNGLLNLHRDASEIPTTKAVQSVP